MAPDRRGHHGISSAEDKTLHLPRILCLHGGGVNGAIFKAQSRNLIKLLPDFRLVFAEAPFSSNPATGVLPVFEKYAPFKRWLRWQPQQPEIGDDETVTKVMASLERCKREDRGDGPWVGVMGFSQGAKLAASLLYDQQVRLEKQGKAGTDFKFGVLLAGRQPIVSLHDCTVSPALMTAGEMTTQPFEPPAVVDHVVTIPTVHVHGLKDPGLEEHRLMLSKYHDPRTSTLIEWEGDHRVPLKTADVERITREIYRLARSEGVNV